MEGGKLYFRDRLKNIIAGKELVLCLIHCMNKQFDYVESNAALTI